MRKLKLLLLASAAVVSCAQTDGPVPVNAARVCFTLGGADCGAFAVATIEAARRSLLVQAYNFTEPRIIDAIVAAHGRGVAVTVIVDKTTARQRGEGVDRVAAAGIATFVDSEPRIAHNKVMVIDAETVLTGSFNWSVNAERYNAENIVALRSPSLAAFYAANFARRLAVSVPYAPRGGARRLGGGQQNPATREASRGTGISPER